MVAARWRGMAAYSLLVWAGCGVLLIPLMSRILKSLAAHEDVIVGNYSIHLWLLSPRGMGYLLLAGSLALFVVILNLGRLLELVLMPQAGPRSVPRVLRRLLADWRDLVFLSGSIFLRCLPWVAILAIGPGLAYLALLTHYDINYYLSAHPPAWWWAIGLSVAWVLTVGGLILMPATRRVMALPAWLGGVRPYRLALRSSCRMTQSTGPGLLKLTVLCVGLPIAVAGAVDLLLLGLTGLVLEYLVRSLHAVVRVIALHGLISGAAGGTTAILGLAWIAGVWGACYRRLYGVPGDETEGSDNAAPSSVSTPRRPFRRLWPLVLVVGVLLAASWGLSAWYLRPDVPTRAPQVIAHRAGAAYAPENSLSALERTIHDGAADGAEIDVTITADGVLVVAHDGDLMKQAGDPREIRETTYADLSEVDIGSSFDSAFADERLGRLEQFIAAARGRLPLVLEFKHGAESSLVEDTVAMVRQAGIEQETMIISLQLDEIRAVQALAPEIKVAYLVSMEVGDLRRLDVDAIGFKDSLVDPRLVQELQEQGVEVYAWTVDDPGRMVELMEMGIDGIITNDPVLARDVIRRYEALPLEYHVLLRFRDFWPALRKAVAGGRLSAH